MSAPLLLSVVVPVRGVNLGQLVRSLNDQTIDPSSFELIVVRESDCEADSSVFRKCRFRVNIISYDRPPGFTGHSAGVMRNIGVRQAAAERVVFIDGDCMPAPDCLARHAARVRDSALVAICGLARELPATFHRERLQASSHDELWVLSARDSREQLADSTIPLASVTWREFYTCNASVSRDLVIKAGLFDETGYRNHDLDLGYRLHLAGVQFLLDSACEVIHLEHPRSIWFREDQIKGWSWLAEKHPELDALVEDEVVSLRRAQRKTLGKAESRFRALTSALPGIRCGSTWVLPPGTTPEVMGAALESIAYARIVRRSTSELFLRLEKNCWDYSLLLPAVSGPPEVSVVIPAHNAESTIGRAIESVLRQSDQSFELIVVDDGSTDLTPRMLAPYFRSMRVRLLSNGANRGLAHCLNRALGACLGNYLLQLDADDWLQPEALERLLDAFSRNPEVGAIYGAPRVFQNRGAELVRLPVERGFPVSTSTDCLTYSRFQAPRIYRVDALKSAGGWRIDDSYEGCYFEDRLMLATIAERHRVLYYPEPLYNVVESDDSLSRRNPLRAGAAKLAILYSEASSRGNLLSYSFNRGLVSAQGFASPPSTEPRRWSIIIPFRGSVDQLALTLRSWLESDVRERTGEIIVVVDGQESLLGAAGLIRAPLIRVVERPKRGGPAAARNTGAKHSTYEWLFFSDSDRIVPPNLLRMHEARHELACQPALVVGDVFGRRTFSTVGPDLSSERKRRLLEMTRFQPNFSQIAERMIRGEYFHLIDPAPGGVWSAAQRYALTDSWQARWGEIFLQYGEDLKYFPHRWLRVGAGSLSLARSTFDALGGFDETFSAMEDWELGIRAQETGYQIICAPEAEPLHQVHPVSEERIMAEDFARTRLAAKHPSVVDHLRRASRDLIPPGGIQFVSPGHEPERTRAASPELESGSKIVLTFDDGPHDHYSNQLLDALAAVDAPAAFFVLGERAKRSAETIRRIVASGHEVGVHGWYHQRWSNLTRDELLNQISRTVGLIEDLSGFAIKYYRPPYGILPVHAAAVCSELGLLAVGWHLSSRDWIGLSSSEIKIELAAHSLGGKVILFHDGYGNPDATATAIRWLVPACRGAGIQPVLMKEYLTCHAAPEVTIAQPAASMSSV